MLNEFYKQVVARLGVSNFKVLRLARSMYPSIDKEYDVLVDRYWAYHDHRGYPTLLGFADVSSDCRRDLQRLYDSAPKSCDVDWIAELRHSHGLDCCPFCGSTMSVQIEHYIPRAVTPEYVALSWNLVPTCGLCNGKRNDRFNNPGDCTPLFHPYFEDLLHVERILGVRLQFIGNEKIFRYKLSCPAWLPLRIVTRVIAHYEACIHEEQFHTVVSSEWRRAVDEFCGFERAGLSAEVFFKTKLHAAELGVGANGWNAALYRSLFSDRELAEQFMCDVEGKVTSAYRAARLYS